MTVPVKILGDNGEGYARVTDKGLLVSVLQYPPLDVPNLEIPFFAQMTVNGDGVTTDLTVNGSVTPIEAFVRSSPRGDIYISTANILIADAGAVALNKFGAQPAMTNGVKFFISTENEMIDTSLGLKTNHDFIRAGTLTQGIGSKTDAYQLANLDPANDDGYNPIIDLTRISGQGIRLRKNTNDNFGITIRDNLEPVSTFNILLTGKIRI